MRELKPTRATAVLTADGQIRRVDVPGSNTAGYAIARIPCLILPVPLPIAECPPEWKDGRRVWLFIKWRGGAVGDGWWDVSYYMPFDGYWAGKDKLKIPFQDEITHIMLPLPMPPNPRGEEGKP